jgi:repressor LexA
MRQITQKELEALRYVSNRLLYGGESPSVRDVAKALGYKSVRSAAVVLLKLAARGLIGRRKDGTLRILQELPIHRSNTYTIGIPLVGSAPCGAPLLAEENIETTVQVSTDLAKKGHRYFLLRAIGDSMNLAGIKDGDLALVRQQETAENGDRVVALIDDEATIKEFHKSGSVIVLKPHSKNKKHKDIIVSRDFRIQGVVVATVPKTA